MAELNQTMKTNKIIYSDRIIGVALWKFTWKFMRLQSNKTAKVVACSNVNMVQKVGGLS